MAKKGDLESFMINWNISYPYDRSWRKRHNIPFMSEAHKNMCLLDILLEEKEEVLFYEMYQDQIEKEKKKEEEFEIDLESRDYSPGLNNWLKSSEDRLTDEELDERFDNLDLSAFNQKKDE